MKLHVKKGVVSKTLLVFIQDSSSSTGAGLPGLVWNSGGLSWYFYREEAGTGPTQVTLTTGTVLGTWQSGGFIAVGANMPGWYEIGLPDTVCADGANFVGMQLKGATNMAQLNIEIQLTELGLSEDVPLTAQDIEDQVNDAINTAIPELSVGVPTATPNLRTATMLPYHAIRNKTNTQTSGTDALELHNDAGTLICKKLLTDVAGDYGEAKMISG